LSNDNASLALTVTLPIPPEERGKGDHHPSDNREFPHFFNTVEQLVEDFIAAIAARRKP